MNILLIEDDPDVKEKIIPIIKDVFSEDIFTALSIQEGIEITDSPEKDVKVVICDYHGSSVALIKCLLEIRQEIPYLIITDMPNMLEGFTKKKGTSLVEVVERSKIAIDLPKALESVRARSGLKLLKIRDEEFIRMTLDSFRILKPLNADVYLRLAGNKYVKIFLKDNAIEEAELKKYLDKTQGDHFYVKVTEAKRLLDRQSQKMNALLQSNTVNPEQARPVVHTQVEIMHEMISKVGFTPQVQDLARKTVSMTLKILGNSPKLSAVLRRMHQEKEQYITSHSVVLAEIACALACKVEWHSSGTFLKLSLAAFLHDLSLVDNKLAKISTLKEMEGKLDLTQQEVQLIKFHPIRAADYAKQFREIPPDVDTIIVEHHERADGSGFPRGLHANQIAPLSCLFIIAHDILDYFILKGAETDIKQYLEEEAKKYTQGMFKKIIQAVQQDMLKH